MKIIPLSIAIFLLSYSVFSLSRIAVSSDSKWSIYTAVSLLQEGNINLNEFEKELSNKSFYGVSYINGNAYPFFPVAPSLMAVPFVYLFEKHPVLALKLMPGFRKKEIKNIKSGIINPLLYRVSLEKHIAAFIMAISVVILFLLIFSLSNIKKAIIISLIYAFCTSVWSTASRGLWQHGPSLLVISLAMYLFLNRSKGNSRIFIFGILMALAYIIRPTNSISILAFAVLIFITERKSVIPFSIGLTLPLIIFGLINLNIYAQLLPPYFAPSRVGKSDHLLSAFWANLISPNRGLFIFSPVLILSLFGASLGFKDLRLKGFYYCISIIILLHVIVISSFPHWWGGYSYGPRFSSDILIYLSILLLPFIQSNYRLKFPLLLILSIPSFIIHYRGANNAIVHRWNIAPKSVDKNPQRIWDWQDLQFLR